VSRGKRYTVSFHFGELKAYYEEVLLTKSTFTMIVLMYGKESVRNGCYTGIIFGRFYEP
jgi:hypothetical protein